MRYNPFNAQIPARPEHFVGRDNELRVFERNVLQTTHSSPTNMCIIGNRGIGKTSILIKMEEIAKSQNCLVFRMSNYEGNVEDIPQLTNYIINGIKQELYNNSSLEEKIDKFGEWVLSLKPVLSYKDFSSSLTHDERKMMAEATLRNNLQKIWEKINFQYQGIVILLDEAESLERIEGALIFLREVFQRLSHTANYSLVLCGKLNFNEKMSELFSPLNRFFPTFMLSQLSIEETHHYIDKMLDTEGVKTTNELKNKIYFVSKGHPYVVVKICGSIFNELGDTESDLTISHFNKARQKFIREIERDFFDPIFKPLTPKAKEILLKLSGLNQIHFTFSEAREITSLKSEHLSPYIQELVRKGCLNRPERANYEFFHELFIDYLKKVA